LWFDCCFIISVVYYICLIVFRLKDLDDTNKFLESARVELASRDLNLEEKLNVLKEDRDRLTQETIKLQSDLEIEKHEKVTLDQNLQRKTEEYETVIEQLKGNWEEATEKLTKLKQQFQVKLKSLKDQLNTSQVRFSFTNF
jgi:chromosome segregation ATPase